MVRIYYSSIYVQYYVDSDQHLTRKPEYQLIYTVIPSFLESGGLRALALSLISTLAKVLTFSLETGSFFLQFLGKRSVCTLLRLSIIPNSADWWYNTEEGAGSAPRSNTAPPPPPSLPAELVPGRCPVCGRGLREAEAGATLAPVSGLVFCYACLVTRVRQAGKCPVTGAPLKEDQLVRIFLPER